MLGRNTMQFHWSQRASLTATSWMVNFLVRLDGRVIGNLRAAVLQFAFDHLGALTARSDAWLDNAPSLGRQPEERVEGLTAGCRDLLGV